MSPVDNYKYYYNVLFVFFCMSELLNSNNMT